MKRALPAFTVLFILGTAAAPVLAATPSDAADGFSWNLAIHGSTAQLAFGEPGTDNVGLTLSCGAKSGRVSISRGGVEAAPKASKASFKLAAGSRIQTYTGHAQVDEMGEGGEMFVTAQAPATDPLLQAFRKDGSIAVVHAGGAKALRAATAPERQAVTRFFTTCTA